MTFNKTQKQEEEYLQKIIGILNQTINNTDQSVKDHVDTLQEYKDYLWSNKISIRMKSVPCVKAF